MSSSAHTAPAAQLGSERSRQTVEFYETERFLLDTINEFVGEALVRGEAAIVIATTTHRRAFESSLAAAGVDVATARATGRLVALDDLELLEKFMISGRPDAGRFRDTMAPLIERAQSAGTHVRIYSELVARLWNERNVAATIALGELWQSLESTHRFSLLCAYPMRAFASAESDAVFERICEQHGAVIPSDPYPFHGSVRDRQRAVAKLQREVVELRATVAGVRAEQERLEQLAHVDPLTGLGNRRAFDRHITREWELSRRSDHDRVLVLADLDFFKDFNDINGHAAGDDLLIAFARMLHDAARSTDILCRIGGDEFAVILIDCAEGNEHRFIERVRNLIGEAAGSPFDPIDVSIGHASLLAASSPTDAFERADRAMYAVKRASHERARSSRRPRSAHRLPRDERTTSIADEPLAST
jgi:diguanylate cyclase (GGDEF)-like protein